MYSFVIYLLPKGEVPTSPLTWGLEGQGIVHTFHFTSIEMWRLPLERLQEAGLTGLLPLCVLAKDGQDHTVAEDVFAALTNEGELLSLALTFASMVFTKAADIPWLERKITMLEDIVRDTWFYQRILQNGLEEGRKEGIKEGIKEGRKEGLEKGLEEGKRQALRDVIIDTVNARFPALIERTCYYIEQVQDVEQLRKIHTELVQASSSEAAERVFRVVMDDA